MAASEAERHWPTLCLEVSLRGGCWPDCSKPGGAVPFLSELTLTSFQTAHPDHHLACSLLPRAFQFHATSRVLGSLKVRSFGSLFAPVRFCSTLGTPLLLAGQVSGCVSPHATPKLTCESSYPLRVSKTRPRVSRRIAAKYLVNHTVKLASRHPRAGLVLMQLGVETPSKWNVSPETGSSARCGEPETSLRTVSTRWLTACRLNSEEVTRAGAMVP
jgi:hypothetical protein